MSDTLGSAGVIPVIPPAQLEQQLQQQAEAKAAQQQPQQQQQDVTSLIGYIKGQFEIFRNHRNTASGWSQRMLDSLRTFNGQYDETRLREIRKFGGSEIYCRLSAQKCRAASSLLRDVYLGPDRPWAIRPPADPPVPPEIEQRIKELLTQEAAMVAQQTGQPPNPSDERERERQLLESARDAAKKRAAAQARDAEEKVEEILREGSFYNALAEFLVNLPIFPFACIKGPIVRVKPEVTWENGQPNLTLVPKLTWVCPSPFDIWFTPGVADIENAQVIEKSRVTRAELNELIDLPGYNKEEIMAVLDEYGRGGLYDNWDTTDATRAVLESRENPAWNRSQMISMMEFHGHVQGRLLQDYGLAVPDELRDYHCQIWCIGNHVIKAQMSPSPRQRHPYFITSFEKVPSTPVGNSLIDLIADLQEGVNGCLRSLINNMAIASGPQVVVDTDQLTPDENPEDLYPWKRWHVRTNALTGTVRTPVSFFMPAMNAQELMGVMGKFIELADDISAIPKYIGGQAGSGGAGRTASGLAMLMGNASKILQTVSANVDRDVIEPAILQLFDLILLTDTSGLLTGEERVSIQGVNVAVQRETQRQRQVEFLQATNNPTDMKIMGYGGRGHVLGAVASTIGLDGQKVVPRDEELDKMDAEQKQQAQKQGPMDQVVEKGVQAGVEAGVKRISTELTAGGLAARAQMPEGPPVHIGTPSPETGGQLGQTNNPEMDLAARHAQGAQPSKLTTEHMGPQTALVGNQPGPGAIPFHGGAG